MGGALLCGRLRYRNLDDRIDGVALTLVDITEMREVETLSRRLSTALHAGSNAVTPILPISTKWPAGIRGRLRNPCFLSAYLRPLQVSGFNAGL
jgi:hypothetical protein